MIPTVPPTNVFFQRTKFAYMLLQFPTIRFLTRVGSSVGHLSSR